MIRVAWDDHCEALSVGFRPEPFLPRSLVAALDGDTVWIRRCTGDETILSTRFDQIMDGAGQGFASADACLAYLAALFERRPTEVPVAAIAAEPIRAGQPVALDRVTGQGRLATAAAYPLAFVAGLARDDAEAGHPAALVRASLTLPDWSVALGAPDLPPGQPLFLARAPGRLTAIPPDGPGEATALVGRAADARTLTIGPSAPILR